jgi:hypothetical protein
MLRYPIILWIAITFVLCLCVLSSAVFGNERASTTVKRLVLAFIWPFAMLTAAGRRVLFNYAKED